MDYGDRDGFGQHGILGQDDDGRLLCHECGRWYRGLGSHIRRHGLTADGYRTAHGLSLTRELVSADIKEHLETRGRRTYAARPDIRNSLAGGRALAAASGNGVRVAAEQAPERRQRAAVRRANSARIAEVNATRGQRERERQETFARSEGHADLRSWLIAHQHLPDRQLGERLGVSRSRAGALRLELVGPQRKSAAQRADAVVLVLNGMSMREAAEQTGVCRDTLRYWVQTARADKA